jgi:hypothetical protein
MPVPSQTFSQVLVPLSAEEVSRCRQLAQRLGSIGDDVETTFDNANLGAVPKCAVFSLIVCVSILTVMGYSIQF